MNCHGPCQSWCSNAPLHVLTLARVSLVYALACVFYVALTRTYGTPFRDSLTPLQLRVKARAVRQRGRAFALALVASCALVFTFRPLTHATK